ncbi:helix-turn-helix transcriptional regulator [Ligilactobacillus acidipiscis]|uniref:helix-turn-helix transcriptional regulator n=1 Tax=Ligilactobacillus acidipiscis TaxID=89059 RepID=UPI000704F4CC|nr:helix-turn-helix transcriptional regulator [Ligilactobacillus acidipiscis]GAW65103.1 XRE family transcriptional regulator [Ligilactobacillus acidipiscis]GEN21725.1 transcriptional regulator [Ligilactobacillus acidipiscis]
MENNVRILREKLNLTQSVLADKVGVTRQTIYLIEVGKYNPTIKLCINICNVLQTDLNSLFDVKK